MTLTDAQRRVLRRIAAHERDHPRDLPFLPSAREWQSIHVLRRLGLTESVVMPRRRVVRESARAWGKHWVVSMTWEQEIRVKLTEAGRREASPSPNRRRTPSR